MAALQLFVTDAGQAAFAAAQLSAEINLQISAVGFTATNFTAVPSLTALPGEFKRVATISGAVVGTDTVHLTIDDSSSDSYAARGFGLFLADGTLFAAYGQATPMFEKSSSVTLLSAIDIRFPTGWAGEIVFGDASFLYPPATETTKGVLELATQAEVDAGTDEVRAVTPKTLAQRLAAFALTIAALLGRTITGSGLATGGGDLSANRTIAVTAASAAEADAGVVDTKAVTPASLVNILGRIAALFARTVVGAGLATGGGDFNADRTITVPKASSADVVAGTADDRAITPLGAWSFARSLLAAGYVQIPFTPVIIQWGSGSASANTTSTLSLPISFPNACVFAGCQGGSNDPGASHNGPYVSGSSTSSISLFSALDSSTSVTFFAIGY